MTNNPYLQQIHRNLPRLLALYDNDSSSLTYGVGDRFYWAWKLIDFPNGTFQAAVSGLALLMKHQLYPAHWNPERLLQRIDSMILGLQRITGHNGSLDEALPNEGSFCVTGLVAADLLLAAETLKPLISREQYQQWLDSAKPLIHFLYRQDEYHGLISNHLATCALALVRWSLCCPEEEQQRAEARARYFLNKILQNQSTEGWFTEYDGADPGYQTWCLASLCAIHQLKPDWELRLPIQRCIVFTQYAAHPDGSFGGSYGSRMTRFVFPSAFEALAPEQEAAARLAAFFRKSIEEHACVTLDAIDAGNLIPLFNDYVQASILYSALPQDAGQLPYQEAFGRRYYPEAGWYIDACPSHYTIVNVKKSGAGLRTFANKNPAIEIAPPCFKQQNGQLISGGFYYHEMHLEETSQGIAFDCAMHRLTRPLPSAFKFLILRTLSLTLFLSVSLGNKIKYLLANYLIHRKKPPLLLIKRTIALNEELCISDAIPPGCQPMEIRGFKPIHMASQGYWQRGDEQ